MYGNKCNICKSMTCLKFEIQQRTYPLCLKEMVFFVQLSIRSKQIKLICFPN